jgi:hypothetical protein
MAVFRKLRGRLMGLRSEWEKQRLMNALMRMESQEDNCLMSSQSRNVLLNIVLTAIKHIHFHAGLDPASSPALDSRFRGNDGFDIYCCRTNSIYSTSPCSPIVSPQPTESSLRSGSPPPRGNPSGASCRSGCNPYGVP